ncbi:MAG TPA: GNAT family N-acetyltransferase [Micromonosporaceae bacterium]|nr:GNAT family N-acetyltransferase [Micromonosporaceae bacterium]
MPLVLAELDGATIGEAADLVAAEHADARRTCPELPRSYGEPSSCAGALRHLLDTGHRGLLAMDRGRPVALMTATVRDVRAVGRYARLPAEGLAVHPELPDPTTVLATVYAELAGALIADGVRRHYLLHVARPVLAEALSNIGFSRDGVYAARQVAPPPARRSGVRVREAGPDDLETVARLAQVEIRHRGTPPMFTPLDDRPVADLLAEHRDLRERGAVHFIATIDGLDAGLVTVEPASPAPRLCGSGQPYIGATATLPEARRKGVAGALVDAALDWASRRGYATVSVDFNSANPLSRPFWLGAGFRPTGYGLMRVIDPAYHPPGT